MTDYTKLLNEFPEINPANYGDDEVNALNAWGIAAHAAIEALQAERDEYQQAADKMAAEHKIERDQLQAEFERERNSRKAAQIENEALKARLASAPLPKTPLDDEQIFEISRQWSNVSFARSSTRFCTDFARAIERAQGIE